MHGRASFILIPRAAHVLDVYDFLLHVHDFSIRVLCFTRFHSSLFSWNYPTKTVPLYLPYDLLYLFCRGYALLIPAIRTNCCPKNALFRFCERFLEVQQAFLEAIELSVDFSSENTAANKQQDEQLEH